MQRQLKVAAINYDALFSSELKVSKFSFLIVTHAPILFNL